MVAGMHLSAQSHLTSPRVCVCVHAPCSKCSAEANIGVCLLCAIWDSKLGLQACWEAPLPTELSA